MKPPSSALLVEDECANAKAAPEVTSKAWPYGDCGGANGPVISRAVRTMRR